MQQSAYSVPCCVNSARAIVRRIDRERDLKLNHVFISCTESAQIKQGLRDVYVFLIKPIDNYFEGFEFGEDEPHKFPLTIVLGQCAKPSPITLCVMEGPKARLRKNCADDTVQLRDLGAMYIKPEIK